MPPAHLTKLEYRVWRPLEDLQGPMAIRDMKSLLIRAEYHFRVNAEAIGIDPLTITTQIQWTGEAECRITFISATAEDVLARAWELAAKLIGLETERLTNPT